MFNLIADFMIDDGELDGLTVQQAFALGVEFMKVRMEVLSTRESRTYTLHRRNVGRLCAVAEPLHIFTSICAIDGHPDWCRMMFIPTFGQR